MRQLSILKGKTVRKWAQTDSIFSNEGTICDNYRFWSAKTTRKWSQTDSIFSNECIICDNYRFWVAKLSEVWESATSREFSWWWSKILNAQNPGNTWRHGWVQYATTSVGYNTRQLFSKPLFWLLHPDRYLTITIAVGKWNLWDSTPNIRGSKCLFSVHAAVPRRSGSSINWSEP